MKLLQEFEYLMQLEGLADQTIKEYVYRVQDVVKTVGELTKENVQTYLLAKKKEGWTANSLNNYVKAIRKLGKLLDTKDLKELLDVSYFKKTPVLRSTLTDDEISRFLALREPQSTPSNRNSRYKMWTVYFASLAYLGLRTKECAELTRSNINFASHSIAIRATKTNSVRTLPIPVPLRDYLYPWVEQLKREKLFTKCYPVTWRYNFRARLKRLGIMREGLTPYSLRHSKATRLVRDGCDLFAIKEIMGHKDIHTTEGYVHLDSTHLKRAMNKDALIEKPPKQVFDEVVDLVRDVCNDKLSTNIQRSDTALTVTISVKS